MITGRVTNLEAIIDLEVAGPTQLTQQIEAVIDTGYNGYLTLPSHLVTAIQLRFSGHRRSRLADGSVVVLDVYIATIVWHAQPRDLLVLQAAGAPLMGMALLHGSRMTMDVIDAGNVIIEELPQRP